MVSAAELVVLLDDDDAPAEIEAEAAAPVAAAAPCKRPPTSSKKRRLALVPLPPLQQPPPLQVAAPTPAGADDVIDLTGDDDAVAAAYHDWELIDLTNSTEDEPEGRGAKSARLAPPEPPVVLDELKEARDKIQAFLRARGAALKVQRCDANPHAAPGTPLYERFVDARRRCRDQRVQLVFHGTPAANVDSISRNGLDPKRRSGQAMGPGEYFGKEAIISVGYCQGGKKMPVFAVLCDKSGVTADAQGVIVVHRPAHQLPLFVITFLAVKPHDMMAAMFAQMPGGAGGMAPPPPPGPFWGLPPSGTFAPFSGAGRMLSAPVRHTLRRAAAAAPGAPPQLCRGCAAVLRGGELALGRTADGAPQLTDLFHLRCAATATWAAEVPLQPLLHDYKAAASAMAAFAPLNARVQAVPLTERELAIIYEELGSDERRAKRRAR